MLARFVHLAAETNAAASAAAAAAAARLQEQRPAGPAQSRPRC